MLIAVPSDAPGGLDAAISDHFGHCAAFTLVEIEKGVLGEVRVLESPAHEEGKCMAPVTMLRQQKVEALVASGMGMRPLSGFRQVGIEVFSKAEATTVREAVQMIADGKGRGFADHHTCGHAGGGGHHHHSQPADVEREPIEGKADVQRDRVVTFEYRLSKANATLIETTEEQKPARYLHGHDGIMPKLEAAMTGLVAGDSARVEVAAADAYGPRDDEAVFEIPRDQLGPEAELGMPVHAHHPSGGVAVLHIVGLTQTTARLDPNHPLAGADVVFEVKVLKVEKATAEEIAHQHVH